MTGISQKYSFEKSIATGVAWGSASTLSIKPGECDPEKVKEFERFIEIRDLSTVLNS